MSILFFPGGNQNLFYTTEYNVTGPGNPFWGNRIEGQYWPYGSASIFGYKIKTQVDGAVPYAGLNPDGETITWGGLYRNIVATLTNPPPNRHRICAPWWWNEFTNGTYDPIGPQPRSGQKLRRVWKR